MKHLKQQEDEKKGEILNTKIQGKKQGDGKSIDAEAKIEEMAQKLNAATKYEENKLNSIISNSPINFSKV